MYFDLALPDIGVWINLQPRYALKVHRGQYDKRKLSLRRS